MDIKMIFELLGGLGLFIYGMHMMGGGLQKAAGDKLKRILEVLTSNRVLAILVGALVTAIIQSSSATTVMMVGFVNAGLMNLYQAAGVIMGANIGTTMTAQLIAFKLTDIAPLVLAIGAAMLMFSNKKKTKDIGEIVFGFGVLFVGMKMMEHSMKPLVKMDEFRNLIITLGNHPILGVLVGLGMTAVVQSSSATIGILQALAGLNAMPLGVALPILFGDNIGTCVTAMLASIGASKNARRASLIHLSFNVIGTLIFMAILPIVVKLIPLLGGDIKRQIANAHTIFNLTNVIIQAPFIPLLVKWVKWLVPGEEKEANAMTLEHLDSRLLETPSIAVGQVVKEVSRMGKIASENLTTAMEAFFNEDTKLINKVFEVEQVINFLEREITAFMVALSNTSLSEHDSEIVTSLFHVVNDIERIGDHADNIAELAQYRIDNKLIFSEDAIRELHEIYNVAKYAVDSAVEALHDFDFTKAQKVLEAEGKIDIMEKQLRNEHIERLNKGICMTTSGTIFLDLISNIERIGDHSNNIAQMVLDFKE
ncbi:Na/Pi cotransporter family protein [Thermobrachium celere]|uniref:Na/Pi cotransporter family protein n=1 Tax=Thermobrachium celere TaxID=53422 RepID=UPI0019404860|nr:Na/Pi cotransporter family protein [Thermobrachium celere]GFR35264.1 Na/Pi cotransporter [Thermobrachium celere]